MQLWEGSGDEAMDVLAWPGHDISGVNANPPLVDCGEHAQLGGRVYLAAHHVVDAVHVLAPAMGPDWRRQIAENIGALLPDEVEELHQTIGQLEAKVAALEENLSVPLAEVIDLVTERQKRPATSAAAPVAAKAKR